MFALCSVFGIMKTSTIEWLARAVGYPLGREVMPVEVKDALTLMIGFGALLIALLTLVVHIVTAINQHKKK
jgi:hypothetical protein